MYEQKASKWPFIDNKHIFALKQIHHSLFFVMEEFQSQDESNVELTVERSVHQMQEPEAQILLLL